jgi:brefeldin A-resistance guanine nucleotide exchange factor 1
LEALIVDTGCKFLFQLARSENISVLHSALRTISTVFDTMRPHLKLQQELFLAFTIDRLAPPAPPPGKRGNGQITASPRPGTPAPATPVLGPPEKQQESETGTATPSRVLVAPARGETRDLILETLTQISRHPSFMVDVYINYDCDINSENLFERLIEFLTKVRAVWCGRCPTDVRVGRVPFALSRRTGCAAEERAVSLSGSFACVCERYGCPCRRGMSVLSPP